MATIINPATAPNATNASINGMSVNSAPMKPRITASANVAMIPAMITPMDPMIMPIDPMTIRISPFAFISLNLLYLRQVYACAQIIRQKTIITQLKTA